MKDEFEKSIKLLLSQIEDDTTASKAVSISIAVLNLAKAQNAIGSEETQRDKFSFEEWCDRTGKQKTLEWWYYWSVCENKRRGEFVEEMNKLKGSTPKA